MAKDMCVLNHVEWKGYDQTVHLYGEADDEPANEHSWRLLIVTSFTIVESYAGVRWATEEERLHTDEVMVIVKKIVAPVAVETMANIEGITVQENQELQGLEIKFPGKPDDIVIGQLKNNGWRWNHKKGLWYNRLTEQNKLFAESLLPTKEAK